jgi:hypothetical protein
VCPDDAVGTVVISAVLDMEYSQYLREEDLMETQLTAALKALGFKVVDIHASKYGHKQTQVVVSLSLETEDGSFLEEHELQALLEQLKSPPILSLRVGHHQEPKSITGVSNPQIQSSSSNHSGGPDKTAAIVAVTLTVAVAALCSVVIAVIVVRARKIRAISKTTTV